MDDLLTRLGSLGRTHDDWTVAGDAIVELTRLRAERAELVDHLGAFCNVAQDFIDGECRYGRVEEFIIECRALLARIGGK